MVYLLMSMDMVVVMMPWMVGLVPLRAPYRRRVSAIEAFTIQCTVLILHPLRSPTILGVHSLDAQIVQIHTWTEALASTLRHRALSRWR